MSKTKMVKVKLSIYSVYVLNQETELKVDTFLEIEDDLILFPNKFKIKLSKEVSLNYTITSNKSEKIYNPIKLEQFNLQLELNNGKIFENIKEDAYSCGYLIGRDYIKRKVIHLEGQIFYISSKKLNDELNKGCVLFSEDLNVLCEENSVIDKINYYYTNKYNGLEIRLMETFLKYFYANNLGNKNIYRIKTENLFLFYFTLIVFIVGSYSLSISNIIAYLIILFFVYSVTVLFRIIELSE